MTTHGSFVSHTAKGENDKKKIISYLLCVAHERHGCSTWTNKNTLYSLQSVNDPNFNVYLFTNLRPIVAQKSWQPGEFGEVIFDIHFQGSKNIS